MDYRRTPLHCTLMARSGLKFCKYVSDKSRPVCLGHCDLNMFGLKIGETPDWERIDPTGALLLSADSNAWTRVPKDREELKKAQQKLDILVKKHVCANTHCRKLFTPKRKGQIHCCRACCKKASYTRVTIAALKK